MIGINSHFKNVRASKNKNDHKTAITGAHRKPEDQACSTVVGTGCNIFISNDNKTEKILTMQLIVYYRIKPKKDVSSLLEQ